jgi:hypothetical protein
MLASRWYTVAYDVHLGCCFNTLHVLALAPVLKPIVVLLIYLCTLP